MEVLERDEPVEEHSSTEYPITKIALIGNPNSGKTSLFNQLTGLNQKVGNYPGITVDKKIGRCRIESGRELEILDLPGTYSIYPKSTDEKIVLDVLIDKTSPLHPQIAVVIVDVSNLKRNLLLLSQIRDLGIPVICALNMDDVAKNSGVSIDPTKLAHHLKTPVYVINARNGKGVNEVLTESSVSEAFECALNQPIYSPRIDSNLIQSLRQLCKTTNDYVASIYVNHVETISGLDESSRDSIRELKRSVGHDLSNLQNQEILTRYKNISVIVNDVETRADFVSKSKFKQGLERLTVHPVWGYFIFFLILYLIFQAIFSWAQIPMDWIDQQFGALSALTKRSLPPGVFVDMLAEGLIPGLGGIVIFVPQIALLFMFIAILEDTGYMGRAVFLMDRFMKKFGLSGKSVVPLISGVACAIPAVMSTRNIENWKERIISIMVTPLMTCSARLPVYVILIALVVPDNNIWGVINLQGLTLLAFYFLGFASALVAAIVFNKIIKTKDASFLVMELPSYKSPRWNNVGLTVFEKSKTFVFEAGKIILAISLILWVLASYGPGDNINNAEEAVSSEMGTNDQNDPSFQSKVNAYKLENSYAASLGKTIEPVISPLGFDWKIGIALITSFAAREVFVGTIATIYSVGSDVEDEKSIQDRMRSEINPKTGGPMYTLPVAFSLLVFYAFAMQCMSTVAIVYRETKSWKWPMIQFSYMTAMAYLGSLLTYQLLIRIL